MPRILVIAATERRPLAEDTPLEIEDLQIKIWRGMSPERKAELIVGTVRRWTIWSWKGSGAGILAQARASSSFAAPVDAFAEHVVDRFYVPLDLLRRAARERSSVNLIHVDTAMKIDLLIGGGTSTRMSCTGASR